MALYDVQLLSMTMAFGLTLGIRVNMTLKQVSKATCSWLDPLSELHIMYHKNPIKNLTNLIKNLTNLIITD